MTRDINMKIIIGRYVRIGVRGFINNPLYGVEYIPIHTPSDIEAADSDKGLHMLIENETYRQLQSLPKINIDAFR